MSVDKEFYRRLLENKLNSHEVQQSLEFIGFGDLERARKRLLKWGAQPASRAALVEALPHLMLALNEAASPDVVLVQIERLTQKMPDEVNWYQHLAQHPRLIETLVRIFSASQFLTEIILRHPDYVYRFDAPKALAVKKEFGEFVQSATALALNPASEERGWSQLRRWQRWELLRIGTCDLLGLYDLDTGTLQLSLLAESLIQAGLALCAKLTGSDPDQFTVVAMGKLGGRELNYSSDIDLLFLCKGQAGTYDALAKRLIDGLSRMNQEGFLYRVDMRLRPWGHAGPLVISTEGFEAYFKDSAHFWEKQALIKARAVAGNIALGQRMIKRVQAQIYSQTTVPLRVAVRAMKQRIEQHLKTKGRDWGEIKSGEGSIRDVEVITQYLQLNHGGRFEALRTPNTLKALKLLLQEGLLNQDDHRVLRDGYVFLRTIEHHLQMMHYRQTHTLPKDAQKLLQLAQRLGFSLGDAKTQLLERYQAHSVAIRNVYHRFLGESHPPKEKETQSPFQAHRSRMHKTYAKVFSEGEIEHHASLSQSLDHGHPVQVYSVLQENGCWQVTIVGYDQLGELSMICGLFTAYGLNTLSGHVFTYEPQWDDQPSLAPVVPKFSDKTETYAGSKIVDVFTVQPLRKDIVPNWDHYQDDLARLLTLARTGQPEKAQALLLRQVAAAVADQQKGDLRLYPVEIKIDNELSKHYTVLDIDSPDTVGFLFELTHALALNGISIGRMEVETLAGRANDRLFVVNRQGRKITAKERQQELRAATVLVKHFTHLLPHSSNPVTALQHFRAFLKQFLSQPNWASQLGSLEQPDVLDALVQLLGVSDFLWEDFLRMQHANLFPVVSEARLLSRHKPKAQLKQELSEQLAGVSASGEQKSQVLNRFKDREMFRIDMRYILGHLENFDAFGHELTDLAEVVVVSGFDLCVEQLQQRYGRPLLDEQTVCPVAICALGKCGGRELGFASDIELMFVFGDNGQTDGAHTISNTLFYEKAVELFLNTLKVQREGIFEIDLRLRPYGNAGSLAVPWESFRKYFSPEGAAWPFERQALVRLRPIGGDENFSQQVLSLRDELVYKDAVFDVAALRAMRERQLRHLVSGGTFNVKFSAGGLVDIEYLVQALQIQQGRQIPSLRQTNTQNALGALAEAKILTQSQFRLLADAHKFFRQLINALRMVRGHAQNLTVPAAESEECLYLANRLQLTEPHEVVALLASHAERVRKVNELLLTG